MFVSNPRGAISYRRCHASRRSSRPRPVESALLAGLLLVVGLAACSDDGDGVAAAPFGLQYTVPATLVVGTSYSFAPNVTGAVETYSVSPALPVGLGLNATTGLLSGTPSSEATSTTYTVTARSRGGSTTATFSTAVVILRQTFVYTNDHSTPGGKVFGFAADQTTGALTRVASVALPNGTYPAHLVAAPNGRSVYVSSGDANAVTRMAIDAASGALSVAETATISQPATALAVDPSGRFLYAASSSPDVIDAFAIDPTSGALTPIARSPFAVFSTTSDLAADRSGRFLIRSLGGNRTADVFAIDPTTGALAPVPGSPFRIDGEAWDVAVSPTADFVLFTDYRDSWLMMYAIDPTTGALTPAPGEPYADVPSVGYAAFDPAGRLVYAAAGANGTQISGHSVDSSGRLTALAGSPYSAPDRLVGIATSPDGRFAYAASGAEVVGYAVDSTTGALALIPGGSGAARAFPWEVVVVTVP